MKMWSMRVIILLLFCYACLSTENRTVKFDSKNFINVLRWTPAEPSIPGQKVLYSVEYRSDAEEQEFQIKEGCQNISALSCDLTNQTPSVYDIHYEAQVLVNGQIHGRTTRFSPLAHTAFGQPNLSYFTTVSSLHVNVSLPPGPDGVSLADIIMESKPRNVKTVIKYTLAITTPKWAAKVNHSTTGSFVLNLKNNQTEYCGYVVYRPSSAWGRSESEKAPFCTKLPTDPLKILPWLLLGAALLVAIVLITIGFIFYYVKGGKKKMPEFMQETPNKAQRKVMDILDGNLKISKLQFNTQVEAEQTHYASIQVKPPVPSGGTVGYSPQDISCPSWQGSADSFEVISAQKPNPEPQDTSAQSSDNYGVVVAQVSTEENKAGQQRNVKDYINKETTLSLSGLDRDEDKMRPKLTTHGALNTPDLDSCEDNITRPLLLHTVRDSNGQLMLPSLNFQSSTADGERKLLLSDLIDSNKEGQTLMCLQSFDSSEWSDSGCDDSFINPPTPDDPHTNHCPSQSVDTYLRQGSLRTPPVYITHESGYKQNWMPDNFPALSSEDCCGYRKQHTQWTCSEREDYDEEENRRGQEETTGGILGVWGLRIQE